MNASEQRVNAARAPINIREDKGYIELQKWISARSLILAITTRKPSTILHRDRLLLKYLETPHTISLGQAVYPMVCVR